MLVLRCEIRAFPFCILLGFPRHSLKIILDNYTRSGKDKRSAVTGYKGLNPGSGFMELYFTAFIFFAVHGCGFLYGIEFLARDK